MEKTQSEEQPSGVPKKAQQEGEIWRRWPWVERAAWTERMLETLEKGVEGGKWFRLIDKVWAPKNLHAALKRMQSRKGRGEHDRTAVKVFAGRAEKHVQQIEQELREQRYQPRAVRRVHIAKPGSSGTRPLGIPTVRDRVVQTALRQVIEPIFEKEFAAQSYGFRPRRRCKDALRQVQRSLDGGCSWVVDVDIERYFDTISHEVLMKEIEKKVADGRVLTLIERFLSQRVMEGTVSYAAGPEGTPQGGAISPLLANIYLHPVDVAMEKEGFAMVRYADDCVVLCRSKDEAERALRRIEELMHERKLAVHPEKTRLVDVNEPGGFDFLGYHFERGRRWPRRKSEKKLRERLRPLTRRTSGVCLSRTIEQINPILRGWFEYFKHSVPGTFTHIDGWLRGRLRSILRKRHRLKGHARGQDHLRWPNRYFEELGLFTMATRHKLLLQSHRAH